ncbi:MAG TPA: hydroxymethylglutaryl-CoA lyase [Cyclobacteriaceae bacterium]|nr:hydroxymethylglutaryl-CoA lyase [Cyclobacteriaceae bacterium]
MKIIECPRDAMQGIEKFIPTEHKVKYINQLLKVGFDTIDFGSFVSPKAIPQLRDTAQVYEQLDLDTTKSKLLAIVANTRGAQDAVQFDGIRYLGFPFSISETFQQRNTNKSIVDALNTLGEIQELCKKHDKVLVTYISMGFGNPYNDPYDVNVVAQFTDILATLEIEVISLADTIGVSKPDQITYLFEQLKKQFPKIEFGAHLHSNPATAVEKIEAAYKAGCNRFDGAIRGWGGCPMAEDELVGNLATETILDYLTSQNAQPVIDNKAFAKSLTMADTIFSSH